MAQDARSHEKLDAFETNVTKTVMPSKQLLFRLGEIEVVHMDSADGGSKCRDCDFRSIMVIGSSAGKVCAWINSCSNGTAQRITRDASQADVGCFLGNAFLRIGLQKAGCAEESRAAFRNIEGWNLD